MVKWTRGLPGVWIEDDSERTWKAYKALNAVLSVPGHKEEKREAARGSHMAVRETARALILNEHK